MADLSGLTDAMNDARVQTADSPKSRRLLRSIANLEQAVHEFTHGEPADGDSDDRRETAGESLKNAAAKARVVLIQRRNGAK